jgi:FdhD protein
MSQEDKRPRAVRYVPAHRISTDAKGGPAVEESVGVALEGTVTIEIEGLGSYTVLCVPEDRRAMVLGFLFSEGIIDSAGDVESLVPSEIYPGVMQVRLAGGIPDDRQRESSRLILSSCGACGSEGIDGKLKAIREVGDTLRVDGTVLPAVRSSLREGQALFRACGGTHAVAIFDDAGAILSAAEDTGRHNALDKAIGKCLLAGVATDGRGAALSGRVSVEMVGKCARAGIELITAISAPTSLAIDIAERCNLTLCAFVRESRATVFTHPRRIVRTAT